MLYYKSTIKSKMCNIIKTTKITGTRMNIYLRYTLNTQYLQRMCAIVQLLCEE